MRGEKISLVPEIPQRTPGLKSRMRRVNLPVGLAVVAVTSYTVFLCVTIASSEEPATLITAGIETIAGVTAASAMVASIALRAVRDTVLNSAPTAADLQWLERACARFPAMAGQAPAPASADMVSLELFHRSLRRYRGHLLEALTAPAKNTHGPARERAQ